MRAPPPPRKSRSRFIAHCVVRLRQFISGHKLKKRWHLHKLHKFQRRGLICLSPESGLRVEDMMNIPSSLQPRNTREKPLLIAAFPKGCSRSPRVRVLQRNRLSRLMISRRKYKLKPLELKGLGKSAEGDTVTHRCAQTVGSIKKATARNADIRVIFHETNVIKCSTLRVISDNELSSPQRFEFAPNRSIRIHDYPSLRRQLAVSQNQDLNMQVISKSVEELSLSKESSSKAGSELPSWRLKSSMYLNGQECLRTIKVANFTNSPIISYSKLVKSPPKRRDRRPRA